MPFFWVESATVRESEGKGLKSAVVAAEERTGRSTRDQRRDIRSDHTANFIPSRRISAPAMGIRRVPECGSEAGMAAGKAPLGGQKD